MIHLQLTTQEADQLGHFLALVQRLSLDDADDALALLHKLQRAQRNPTLERQCPVCHSTFSPAAAGRTGIYCSSACKQKAYRQRINARKRQFGPAFRR